MGGDVSSSSSFASSSRGREIIYIYTYIRILAYCASTTSCHYATIAGFGLPLFPPLRVQTRGTMDYRVKTISTGEATDINKISYETSPFSLETIELTTNRRYDAR